MSNSDTAWNVFPSCYCAIWVNIHQHFCKKTPQAASGSTRRVKAVIIEATQHRRPEQFLMQRVFQDGSLKEQGKLSTSKHHFFFSSSPSFYVLSFQDPKFLTLEMMVMLIMQGFHTAGVLWICIQWANQKRGAIFHEGPITILIDSYLYLLSKQVGGRLHLQEHHGQFLVGAFAKILLCNKVLLENEKLRLWPSIRRSSLI